MKRVETSLLTMTIVHNEETNEVLLINRPKEKGFPGYIGPGGKIELDESFSEGAAREVEEETGLRVNPEDLIYKGVDEFIIPNENYRYIVFNYLTTKYEGELLENAPEGNPEWISFEDLNKVPMQSWFKRRLPKFFERGTFEISVQYENMDSKPKKDRVVQLS